MNKLEVLLKRELVSAVSKIRFKLMYCPAFYTGHHARFGIDLLRSSVPAPGTKKLPAWLMNAATVVAQNLYTEVDIN